MEEIVHKGLRARRIGDTKKYIREDGVVIWKYKSKEGYKETSGVLQRYLSVNIGTRKLYVHRLVAQAFLPNPANLPYVDHIDENKENNNLSNLRWCTAENNSKLYHQSLDKAVKREFLQCHQEVNNELTDRIMELSTRLELLTKENTLLLKEIEDLRSYKLSEIESFEEYRSMELAKIAASNVNYTGYKSIKGHSFSNVTAMIKATGKKIVVDGTTFISAGSAATYIITEESKIGNTRKHNTISKELRRYLQGKRSAWVMYGKYTIGY